MNNYLVIIVIVLIVLILLDFNKETFTNKIIKVNKPKIQEDFNSNEFNIYLIHMAKNTDRLINFNNYYNN